MVSMRLLVFGVYLLLRPACQAKSLYARLIDEKVLTLENTRTIIPKGHSLKDPTKDDFFKQFTGNEDYLSEGLGSRGRMNVQFSAYLSRQETIRKKRPIRFDKILQNDGKCYKIATGIFEAPIAGLYSFTITSPPRHEDIDVHLVLYGKIKPDTAAQVSEFVDERKQKKFYVTIKRDSAVWVESDSDGLSREDKAISFSGKLLYAT